MMAAIQCLEKEKVIEVFKKMSIRIMSKTGKKVKITRIWERKMVPLQRLGEAFFNLRVVKSSSKKEI